MRRRSTGSAGFPPWVVALLLLVGGCFGDAPPAPPLLKVECQVSSTVAGEIYVGVCVEFRDVPVDDADVWINAIPIPYEAIYGCYSATLIGFYPGDDVELTVARGETVVSGTVQMPDDPVVLAPTAAGSPYDAGSPIVVQWSPLSPAPDGIHLSIPREYTVSGERWYFVVSDGTATQAEVPANTLWPYTGSIYVKVAAANFTVSLGSEAEAGSYIGIYNGGFSEYFSTSP